MRTRSITPSHWLLLLYRPSVIRSKHRAGLLAHESRTCPGPFFCVYSVARFSSCGPDSGTLFSGNIGDPFMTDDLLRFRAEFPILERTTYMISNSLGAMPRGVYDAVHSYCDVWATRGVRAWEEQWWMMAREVGDAIGVLMNAAPGSVSPQLNVTGCQAVIASCFDFS